MEDHLPKAKITVDLELVTVAQFNWSERIDQK